MRARVEVPFEGNAMPTYFVSDGEGEQKLVVVYYDGLDSNKELLYFSIAPDLIKGRIFARAQNSKDTGVVRLLDQKSSTEKRI